MPGAGCRRRCRSGLDTRRGQGTVLRARPGRVAVPARQHRKAAVHDVVRRCGRLRRRPLPLRGHSATLRRPKDIRSLKSQATELGVARLASFLREVDAINISRRARVVSLTREACGTRPGGRMQPRLCRAWSTHGSSTTGTSWMHATRSTPPCGAVMDGLIGGSGDPCNPRTTRDS